VWRAAGQEETAPEGPGTLTGRTRPWAASVVSLSVRASRQHRTRTSAELVDGQAARTPNLAALVGANLAARESDVVATVPSHPGQKP